MTSVRSTERLQRHQILLYAGDYDRLGGLFRERSAAEVIRALVRRYIEDVEQRVDEAKRVG